MPEIPATREMEIRLGLRPAWLKHETLSEKQTKSKRTEDVAEMEGWPGRVGPLLAFGLTFSISFFSIVCI
jgi:hypothetical protein